MRHLPQVLIGRKICCWGGLMTKSMEIEVNGKRYAVSYPPDTPLLFVLRDELGLTGTKYGCGEGQCGACTVLLAGAPRRSCQVPLRDRKSTRLNSSHVAISYAVFCLKKKKKEYA